MFISGSIRKSTVWTAFEVNNPELQGAVIDQVREFLSGLREQGRLAGKTDADAFYIRCDEETNAGMLGHRGELGMQVGVALEKPGNFLSYHFVRNKGECAVTEAGWAPAFTKNGH